MTSTAIVDGRSLRAHNQREVRRAEILEVALSVFAQRGYHQTRITDIIEAAGVARGTFYLYFDSKSAIFLELLDNLLAHLRNSVVGVDITPNAPPVEDQLVGTARRILETVASNRLLTTIIIREAVGLDDEVDLRLGQFYENLLAYIRAALEEGKRMRVIRPLDTHVAAMCILGSIKQMMEQYVRSGANEPFEVDRTARALLDYNLRGLLA